MPECWWKYIEGLWTIVEEGDGVVSGGEILPGDESVMIGIDFFEDVFDLCWGEGLHDISSNYDNLTQRDTVVT